MDKQRDIQTDTFIWLNIMKGEHQRSRRRKGLAEDRDSLGVEDDNDKVPPSDDDNLNAVKM